MVPLLVALISHFGHAGSWLLEFWAHGPHICEQALPATPNAPLYAAMDCGIRLPGGATRQLFIDTGLIHLMVVSGAHLAFLENGLFFLPRAIRLCGLGAFCFFTGFQPPIFRAFLRRILAPRWIRDWSPSPLQIEAGLIGVCLLLNPPWFVSRSFSMTWMAGLALSSPAWIKRPQLLDWAVKCYVFLLPFVWASPATISWNITLAPWIGAVLFPASLLSLFFHPLAALTDWLWAAVIAIMKIGPQSAPLPIFWPTWALMFLPPMTHLLLLVLEVHWRRKSAFSSSPC